MCGWLVGSTTTNHRAGMDLMVVLIRWKEILIVLPLFDCRYVLLRVEFFWGQEPKKVTIITRFEPITRLQIGSNHFGQRKRGQYFSKSTRGLVSAHLSTTTVQLRIINSIHLFCVRPLTGEGIIKRAPSRRLIVRLWAGQRAARRAATPKPRWKTMETATGWRRFPPPSWGLNCFEAKHTRSSVLYIDQTHLWHLSGHRAAP